MLLLAAIGCNPMVDLQQFPSMPLELDRDYAPAFAGCTWTRTRVGDPSDNHHEEILAEFDTFGRLLHSRVDDVNGLRDVTNTWDGPCLVRQEIDRESSRSEVLSTCDDRAHPQGENTTWVVKGHEAPETGVRERPYFNTYEGDEWVGWDSPGDGWVTTFQFEGTNLVWKDNLIVLDEILTRSSYSWDGDRLLSVTTRFEDRKFGRVWGPEITTWTYDDAGRITERNNAGLVTTYTYVGDSEWPESALEMGGDVHDYTWDCR